MTTTLVTPPPTPTGSPLPPGCRSARLWEDLAAARAGRRAVALYGNTSDVLVAENGNLVRIEEYLAYFSAARGATLVVLDRRHGARQASPPGAAATGPRLSLPPDEPAVLLGQVSRALAEREAPATVLLDWACLELATDDGDLLRTLLEVPGNPNLSARDHQLVVVFRTGAPPGQLTTMPGWAVLAVDLPDAGERRYVLGRADRRAAVPLDGGLDVAGVATTLGGTDADGLLRLANEARSGAPLTADRLIEIKAAEIVRTAGGTLVVDRRPPPNGLAGMAGLRLHVETSLAAGVPIGAVLLAGVPGVGKTYSFRWLAHRLGLPPVHFGQLRGGIVGETEQRFEQARRVLRANAPAVVLIDEADQVGLGSRGANLDSGVSDRLRAGMFDLINEADDDDVTYVLTTNDPARIDVAGIDRLAALPVIHPSLQESVEIMALAAARAGWTFDQDDAAAVLAARDDLLTGRQLVRLLQAAMRHAGVAGRRGQVLAPDLEAAAVDSMAVTDRLSHEYMALSALALADSKAAFPWVAARRLGEPAQIPSYLVPLLDADGNLDMVRLQARRLQLAQAGHGFDR